MPVMNWYEIGGLVVTVVAAIVAVLKSNQQEQWLPGMAVVSLGLTLTFVISLRYQHLPAIIEGRELAVSLQRSPKTLHLATAHMAATKAASESRDPLFSKQIEYCSRDFIEQMEAAKSGRYIVSKADIGTYSNELVNGAKKSIVATSYVKSAEWWDTPWGRQYEEQNYRLIDAGVAITRIFIFSNRDEFKAAREMVLRQVAHNVKALVVFTNTTDYQHRQDLIVVDDVVAGELLLTPEKEVVSATMCTSSDDIDRINRTLRGLMVRAIDPNAIPVDQAKVDE